MRMTGKVKNKNKKKSQAAAVWRRLKKNKMAVLGLIILAVIIFFAVFADVFFDYETLVIQQNASLKLQPPSVEHWLGTDEGAATSWPGSSTAPGSPCRWPLPPSPLPQWWAVCWGPSPVTAAAG